MALRKIGLRVWYDEFTVELGDSLNRKINQGLANSRYGVVILSKHFFRKEWSQKELDGLMAREVDGLKVILPVWHKIEAKEVRNYSPIMADRLAVSTDKGIEYVIAKIVESVRH